MSSRPRRDCSSTPKTRSHPRPAMPSPPSPVPRTSSPLSQTHTTPSISDSYSSHSIPSPSSPPPTPRGRLPARYPTSLSRVPLHRRGTSHTYERLEDLLREAGYKETRVFTPETERTTEQGERNSAGTKGGVGAVVGFLAGLVPGALSRNTSLVRSHAADEHGHEHTVAPYSPPSSPLAHKQHLTTSPSSPSTSSHSSLRPHLQSRTNLPQPRSLEKHHLPHVRPQSSTATLPYQTYAQASRARAYLRHMASAPNIHPAVAPQPHRAPAALKRGEPPLPHTWLETVARAVLFGGAGAHAGGPGPASSAPGTSSPRGSNTRSLRPPPLLAPPRPLCAPVAVSRTRVVCRSAPGSRSGSRVRSVAEDWANGGRGKRRGKGKEDKGRVPSLARTRAEGDGWGKERGRARGGANSNRYLSGWGIGSADEGFSSSGSDDDTDRNEEEEEEEEGELDLARILVPPKRQNSIRSLRKHLHAHTPHSAQGSLRGKRPASRVGWSADEVDEGDDWAGGERWGRNLKRGRVDEDGWGGGFDELLDAAGGMSRGGSARSTGTLRRRGIPGAWAQLTGVRA